MPKYTQEIKDRAFALIAAGFPDSEISAELAVPRNSVWRWRKEYKAAGKGAAETIEGLQKQLSTLSRRKPTPSISHQIAKISNALGALEGLETKRKKALAAKASRPTVQIERETQDMQIKALDIGGLYEYQKDFLLDDSQFRLILKSRQIGFSFVCGLDALLGAAAGRNQLFLSASEEQGFILMRYCEGWAGKLGVSFIKDAEDEKKLSNGARIKVVAHNFRTVQGWTGDVYMDEFAWYINPKRMWQSFVPSIGAVKGRLTICSTPFEEESLFYRLWNDELKYPMFSRHFVDIYKAVEHGLDVDIETMRALFDADSWASAYECQFIDDESAMFPISLIRSCVDNKLRLRMPASTAVLFCGYDIGRTNDRSALTALELTGDCYRLAVLDMLAKQSFEAQQRHIAEFMRAYPLAQIRLDQTGIGMQLAETTHKLFGARAQGVSFTQTVKSIMVKNLKKLFEDKKIAIPNDQQLIADIHSIKRIAGQKDFRYDSDRNQHGHADRFWSLALAAGHIQSVIQSGGKGRAWMV